MRMSCSGCRVLRKGCSDNCSIRPCLQWIKSPQAQANATVFLAKFYGRAGLINLIDAGPEHLRPAIFRSLLFEACGRMVNPIYGSAGLLWSGSWQLCQAAVEAVLKGAPIMQIPTEALATGPASTLHKPSSCDIRHVAKEDTGVAEAAAHDLHKVNAASRVGVKRSANRCCNTDGGAGVEESATAKRQCCAVESHGSQASEGSSTGGAALPCEGDSRENETTLSLETAEAYSMVTSHGDANTGTTDCRDADNSDVELDLTLGFKSFHNRDSPHSTNSSSRRSRAHSPTCSSSRSSADDNRMEGSSGAMLAVDLRLDLAA